MSGLDFIFVFYGLQERKTAKNSFMRLNYALCGTIKALKLCMRILGGGRGKCTLKYEVSFIQAI